MSDKHEILQRTGGTIILLPEPPLTPAQVDPHIVGLIHIKLVQIHPVKITVKWDGNNVPAGNMPIPGTSPQSKFDIKLGFITAFVPGKLVEFLFEIESGVDLTFWEGYELTSGDPLTTSLLNRLDRGDETNKKVRMVVGKDGSGDPIVSYNIGVVVPQGDGYYEQQHWDPKIKNHG